MQLTVGDILKAMEKMKECGMTNKETPISV